MMHWAIINTTMSAIDAAIIAYTLRLYGARWILFERVGAGLAGAALILTIAPILANRGAPYLSRAGTPYNMWPSFVLRLGLCMFFVGSLYRHRRHDRANAAMVASARGRFAVREGGDR